jgi:Family of unknown function (DUF6282)
MEKTISLEGMYDLHVHAAPSIVKRRLTAIEVMKVTSSEGMAGVMLLDHTYNTVVVAQVVNELGLRAKAFGTILLNESVGGINPWVVETALQLGTHQIQMPTYSSQNHKERYGDDQKVFPYQKKSKGVRVLDDRGRLITPVEEVLEIMKGKNSFLGTGHLGHDEVRALVKRAGDLKIRTVITSVSTDIVDLPEEIQKELASDLVFMEHDYSALSDMAHKKTPIELIAHQIRSVGAARCVLGTDAGAMIVPDLITEMKDFIGKLTAAGITESELDVMLRKTPPIVLGLL